MEELSDSAFEKIVIKQDIPISISEFKDHYNKMIINTTYQDDELFIYLMGKYNLEYPDNKIIDITNTAKIMIIGDTGVGKSVICNALFNENIDEYRFLYAPYVVGTTHLSQTSTVNSQISINGKYFIYDTPGLGDNRKNGDDILYKLIYDITKATYIGLDKVIIVIKHGRFSRNINDTFKLINDIFGKMLFGNLIIIHNYCDSGKPKLITESILKILYESEEIHPDFKSTIKLMMELNPIEIQSTFLIHDNTKLDEFYFKYRQQSLDIIKKAITTKSSGLKFEISENTLINIVQIIGKQLQYPFEPSRIQAQLKRDIEINNSKVQTDLSNLWKFTTTILNNFVEKIDWGKILTVVTNKII